MSKRESTPRIGTIKFTAKEKEIIAIGVESDFFKIIANKLRPQRQTKIALTCLNAAMTESDLAYYKGQSFESDMLVKILQEAADSYNKMNLDADTDGVDGD